MRRILDGENIRAILYGAAFLSTGAGGTLNTGLRILDDLEKEGGVSLELITPDEMEEDGYAATVIGYGSPDVFLNTAFGADAQYAFDGMRATLAREGKKLSAIYSVELAGFNTMTPIYVAVKNHMPLLDVDCNGKAFPTFEKSLYTVRGGLTTPICMGGGQGDYIHFVPGDPMDFDTADRVIHKVCEVYEKIGLGTCVIPADKVASLTIPGMITLAEQVGRIVLDNIGKFASGGADADGRGLIRGIRSVTDGRTREICRGRIVRLEKAASAAYNKGTVVIDNEPDGRRVYVDFKNENLLIRDGSKVIATVPETICTYFADTGEPVTNSELSEGMRIGICVVPAPQEWWEREGGFGMYRSMLEEMGYTGEAVRL